MKTFAKTLLAGGALAFAGLTQAATITVYDDAAAGESAFLSSLYSVKATEDFNGLGGAPIYVGTDEEKWENSAVDFSTAVGKFEMTAPGQNTPLQNELKIESEKTGESGRELPAGDFWLDSNDATEVKWTLGAPLTGKFNAFGFYLYDASDISADLTLTLADNSLVTLAIEQVLYPEPNGNSKYISVVANQNILDATLTFAASTNYDGWGIDNVTVGHLPEPGTLLLMGLGLLGLGAARRRAAK